MLKQAQSAGIKVVTHEASNQKNTDVDIEGFNNADYGAHIMDNLQVHGRKGKYAAFVGHLTAKSHMEWVEGALNQAKEKYPGIQRVGGPIEANEDRTSPTRRRRSCSPRTRTSRASRAAHPPTSPGSAARSRRPACRTRSA